MGSRCVHICCVFTCCFTCSAEGGWTATGRRQRLRLSGAACAHTQSNHVSSAISTRLHVNTILSTVFVNLSVINCFKSSFIKYFVLALVIVWPTHSQVLWPVLYYGHYVYTAANKCVLLNVHEHNSNNNSHPVLIRTYKIVLSMQYTIFVVQSQYST